MIASLKDFRHDRSTFGFNKSIEGSGAAMIRSNRERHSDPMVIKEKSEDEESVPLVEPSSR